MTAPNLQDFDQIAQNLPSYCLEAFQRRGNSPVVGFKSGDAWKFLTGSEMVERVRVYAAGLEAWGIEAGDRVAIISENRPEWSLVDIAILSLGAVNVPIYTTQATDQIRYILENSGAKMLFVSGEKLWKHAKEGAQTVESLQKVIFFDEAKEGGAKSAKLDDLETAGREYLKEYPHFLEDRIAAIKENEVATIIYTSGTTGTPKGVMLSHDNFISNINAISKGLPILSHDRSLAVLPLSHIFERAVFYVLTANGVLVHYCSAFEQIANYLKEVKPTIMTAVPRLFEQVYHKIVKKGMSAGGVKTRLFEWSLKVGQEYWAFKDTGERVPAALKAKHLIADKLVFSKWRDGVGGALRFFVSGGAPLSKKLSYAFWAAGIPILQGYGMTEACIVCANRPADNKVGSIGRPFEGVEMKIAEKDGEVLIRGRCVMLGYYNDADATALAVDEEGFYHTGDIGYTDTDGHFYITDRLKDLFKLSNGKYIAPLQVESLLKQSPLIGQAVVVGSGRKQVGVLIVPDWEALKEEMKPFGADVSRPREELASDPLFIKRVQKDAVALTAELSDYERVKRVALLPREFSIDKGEMTPTLKIKRSVVDEKYGPAIDEICG